MSTEQALDIEICGWKMGSKLQNQALTPSVVVIGQDWAANRELEVDAAGAGCGVDLYKPRHWRAASV